MAESPLPPPPSPLPSPPRPYFIPECVDYAALPEPVRQALVCVVGKAYLELVERAMTAMERSMGVTVVFLLTMEVLDQFALARVTDFGMGASDDAASKPDTEQRDKRIDAYLRLISGKQTAARFMHRLRHYREHLYVGTLSNLPRVLGPIQ